MIIITNASLSYEKMNQILSDISIGSKHSAYGCPRKNNLGLDLIPFDETNSGENATRNSRFLENARPPINTKVEAILEFSIHVTERPQAEIIGKISTDLPTNQSSQACVRTEKKP